MSGDTVSGGRLRDKWATVQSNMAVNDATFLVADDSASPVPTSNDKQEIVEELESRIADWIKDFGADDAEWIADRARLELQLGTARLDLATVLLVEARKDTLALRKKAVKRSLRLVQDADRTLERINVERLDDFDRRAYRGLQAMRHRVSSIQIDLLLGMVDDGGAPSTTTDTESPSAGRQPIQLQCTPISAPLYPQQFFHEVDQSKCIRRFRCCRNR